MQTRISLQRIIFHNRDKRIIPCFLYITTFLSKKEEEEEEKIRDPFKDRLPIKIGDKVAQTRISLQRIIFHNRDKHIIPCFFYITTFLSKEEEEEEENIRDPLIES